MYYFSYGSNMSIRRLVERIPSAKAIGVAKLAGHILKFHKASKDGSGKCDILATDQTDDIVFGVVFEIATTEKTDLDRAEGLGLGYEEKYVQVTGPDKKSMRAITYYATNIESSLKPYQWYKEHVLRGAIENELPPDYIAEIEKIEPVDDPDQNRHEKEISIYR